MRVIAGKARHLILRTPKGSHVRPTTDRIKETLFNMIQMRIQGSRFLDLFAGSGGIGIEALSRGADFCVFCDTDREALACIRSNLATTGFAERSAVLAGDYSRTLNRLRNKEPFDIIFMDPPYGNDLEINALKMVESGHILAPDGLVILETPADQDIRNDMPDGMHITKEKVYKSNKHIFIEQGE